MTSEQEQGLARLREKSAEIERRAEDMVLVESDGCTIEVNLWHGVTNVKTGKRAGVRTVATYDDVEEGVEQAEKLRTLLVWWMTSALNLANERE